MFNVTFYVNSLQNLYKILFLIGIISANALAVTPRFESLYTFGQHLTPDSSLVHDAANNHYGINSQGGALGLGTISKIDPSGKSRIIYTFDGKHGKVAPNLILSNDGKIYGWTVNTNFAGPASNAVIYQLDISQSSPIFTVLYNNTETSDIGEVIFGRNGKLYGTKKRGTRESANTIFQLDITQPIPAYQDIYSIVSEDGNRKDIANLIHDSDNLFYGIAKINEGSRFWSSEVFMLNTASTPATYRVLKRASSFTGAQAEINLLNLSLSAQGILYAIVNNSRYNVSPDQMVVHAITLFKIDSTSQPPNFTDLAALNGYSSGRIIQGNNGRIYLSTDQAMFAINVSTSSATADLLFNASGNNEITIDLTAATQGQDGLFYGTGKSHNNNSIIQVDSTGTNPVYTALHTFNSAVEGKIPYSQAFQTEATKILAVTHDGGIHGSGTLFQLDVSGTTPKGTDLRSFNYYSDFPSPNHLIQGSDGKIYGISRSGEVKNSFEFIFKLDTTVSAPGYSILHSFNDNSYVNSLIQGKDGKFFGSLGGYRGEQNEPFGEIFKFDNKVSPASYTVLHSFDNLTSLFEGKVGSGIDNNLYGREGSYKIDLSANPPLYSELSEPYSAIDLTKGSDGKFYGVSQNGDRGTIFQVDTAIGTPVFNILHNFPAVEDQVLNNKLVEGRPGKFYGTVKSNYNTTYFGYIFELDMTSGAPVYTVIHPFKFYDGTSPETLIKAADGHLYGITEFGGSAGGNGTIFRVRLDSPPPAPINTAPIAKNDSFVLRIPKRRNAFVMAAPGVLKNDTDAEKNKLSVAGATATKPKIIQLGKKSGSVALYADGHFVYIPPHRCFYGSRTFLYQATDGKALSNPATVTLTFHGDNKK